jgi:iron complex transport system permease protein
MAQPALARVPTPTPPPVPVPSADRAVHTRPAGLRSGQLLVAALAVLAAGLAGVAYGPVALRPDRVLLALIDALPLLGVDAGLDATEVDIVTGIRLPRVVLALIVGGLLSVAGASYQGVFRNPLAEPYLLGVAAGAGLGATVAIVAGAGDGAGWVDGVPLAAFAGALGAVALTLALSGVGSRARQAWSGPATLLLAGVAVSSFLAAVQTYLLQRRSDATLRQVYSWLLGRLTTGGWGEVAALVPYAAVAAVVLIGARRWLDVLALGDEEAAALGARPVRLRLVVVAAASLAAAVAVAAAGLIGFVGLVVPHCVRLVAGGSNRVVVPLSLLYGAAFLTLADLAARTVQRPAELPIGVVTAFVGAPFFVLLLRRGGG